MSKKTPGRLNPPPDQEAFNRLPLEGWCRPIEGPYYRLHSRDALTGRPWPAIHFSRKGRTRFDPAEGVGTLYLAETLGGALMETFDDRWGPVGSLGRSLTEQELREWWVTLIDVPQSEVLEASGPNLSKLGTDIQLLTGDHETARQWALRLMRHPRQIAGISYRSRHDDDKRNVALFRRPDWLEAIQEANLIPAAAKPWRRKSDHGRRLVYGPPVLLGDHPELAGALGELEVAILP